MYATYITKNSICYTIEHTRIRIQISILKKEQRVGTLPREFQIWNALYSDFVFLIRIQLLFSITVGWRQAQCYVLSYIFILFEIVSWMKYCFLKFSVCFYNSFIYTIRYLTIFFYN